MGGYLGKLLRIDLSKDDIREEKLPEESTLRQFIGGTGLGARILYNEVGPKTQPTDAENPLIFMTGPLTGTTVPCSSNSTVVTVNAEVDKMIGTSHSHGFWGAQLKFAGYDGVIIKGKAKRPVYLSINDGKVEIRDAKKIWGKDTHETEDLVKQDLRNPNASVGAIGPAGENQVFGAFIEVDYNHSWAKGGCGKVMGSKNLKAIAVYGTGTIPIADPATYLAVSRKWRAKLFDSPSIGNSMARAGILFGYKYIESQNILANRNFSTSSFPEYAQNIDRIKDEFKVEPTSCWACPISCSYRARVTSGPKKGFLATLSGGGENTEAAAANVGITDPGWIVYMTDLYDRLGMDSGSMGLSLGLAFELYEKGIITKDDTDGLELTWGNAEAAEALLRKAVKREGFGAVLAEGPKKAAEKIGRGAEKYAVHVKGGGLNYHDWRAAWSVMLGQIVAGAGGRWEGYGVDVWAVEPDLGLTKFHNAHQVEGKADAVRMTQFKKLWEDSIGICWIGAWGCPGALGWAAECIGAATGWKDFSAQEALAVGERVVNLQRIFNLRQGFEPRRDFEDLGKRLIEAPPDGVAKGKPLGPHLEKMIKEYYHLMGWDEKTGKPLAKTLKKAGLEGLK
ncbi:MAG: aldehyde ferredoxin oxidoreductase family protein [Desulfobacterales bacterium]|nr:MAG: aldehyde ferredoxin oxidoreductase family protein [Desulfobacterales bacterium]